MEGKGGDTMNEDLEYVEQVKEMADKLNCHVKERNIKSLLKYYLLANGDEKSGIKEDIDSIIGIHLPKLTFSRKPMLPSPEKDKIDGEIKIGKVFQGDEELYDFGISKEELNQHMLIVARSGFGKTTLIVQIMRQLIENKIPFIAFDYKRDCRHLIRHFPELVVLSWRDLRINPLEPPPSVSFQEWKQQFLNIFGHVQAVWHGSTQYLLEAIDKTIEEKKGLVTLEDVYKKIVEANETTKKMQEYASVIETRLYGLLSKLGETINNERTLIDMEKLLQLPVVIELDGLGRDEASILALWLFYWVYAYRKAKSIRGKLLHVLIIDEAKRIFTASEQYSQTTTEYSGIPPADLVCDEIRDFGEGIIASDQEPTKLSDSLKANTYTKITGFLGNGKDINDIAEAMDLSEDERKAITKLERGEWLVKLAGRYVKPFTIRTEDFPIEKNVSDEELRQKMRSIIESLLKAGREKIEKVEEVSLSEDSWKLLESINSHPFNGIVSRQRELGISVKRFEKAKQELISRGLVKQLSISLSKRRPTSFLVLTNEALQILEAKGLDTSVWKHVGNVGFEHMLYQVLIRWQLKKLGYDAHIEVEVAKGRRMDVLAIKNGRKIGIEVELNANVNLKEKLNEIETLDGLYIVTSKELFNEIREKLGDLPSNVKLYSIDRFLERFGNLFGEETGNNSSSGNDLKFNSSGGNQSNSSLSKKEKLGGKGIGEG
jgi:KaiC/GvpD/RAD55 family RecA-like ATPase